MGTFKLLRELQSPKKDLKTPLPKGIKYDEHIVVVENQEFTIHTPSRERENVNRILEAKTKFSYDEINDFLRKFRGIRG